MGEIKMECNKLEFDREEWMLILHCVGEERFRDAKTESPIARLNMLLKIENKIIQLLNTRAL